jgi:DNA ligase 1
MSAVHPHPVLTRRGFVGGLVGSLSTAPLASWAAAASGPATPAPMPPLMLAGEAPADIDPAGYLVSEKLDGVRAVWDGARLRFRSGLAIAAPHWFAASLPAPALDGELWLGRGRFEPLSAAVRRAVPRDDEWRQVRYAVFDLPGAAGPFAERAARLDTLVRRHGWAALQAVAQTTLPDRMALQRRLDAVVRGGGEGLMLHRADALHAAGRSTALLKLKPLHDAEAVVVGHTPGRGRHAGRLGALRVRTPEGVNFLIGTGLSDALREQPPPPGAVVTYTYRGLTAAGVPRFASFLRMRAP